MIVGIATDCRPESSTVTKKRIWKRSAEVSFISITLGRPYKTESDGDEFAMCVFGRLSVTPLHCVEEVCVTPENFRFLLQRVYPVSVVEQS